MLLLPLSLSLLLFPIVADVGVIVGHFVSNPDVEKSILVVVADNGSAVATSVVLVNDAVDGPVDGLLELLILMLRNILLSSFCLEP